MNDQEAYKALSETLAVEAGMKILEIQSDEVRDKVQALLEIMLCELTGIKEKRLNK